MHSQSLSVDVVLSNKTHDKINKSRLLRCGYSKCLYILFLDSHGQFFMVSFSSGFTGFYVLQMTTAESFCSQMMKSHRLVTSMPAIFQ